MDFRDWDWNMNILIRQNQSQVHMNWMPYSQRKNLLFVLFVRELELDEDDEVGEGGWDHAGEGAPLNTEQQKINLSPDSFYFPPEHSTAWQGSRSFNFLQNFPEMLGFSDMTLYPSPTSVTWLCINHPLQWLLYSVFMVMLMKKK